MKGTQAVSHAQQVPTAFVYEAIYSQNSGRENNQIYFETHRRSEMSVFFTYIETLGPDGDPRAPWTDCTEPGTCQAGEHGAGDQDNPHLQQEKYPDLGSNIPVVKGTEMRLIEAEAALRNNNLPAAMAKINEVRAFHGLDPLTATGIPRRGVFAPHRLQPAGRRGDRGGGYCSGVIPRAFRTTARTSSSMSSAPSIHWR